METLMGLGMLGLLVVVLVVLRRGLTIILFIIVDAITNVFNGKNRQNKNETQNASQSENLAERFDSKSGEQR